jgi:hypothetical protein
MFIQRKKSASLRCVADAHAQASLVRTSQRRSVDEADLMGSLRATIGAVNITEAFPALAPENLSLERTPLRGAAQLVR